MKPWLRIVLSGVLGTAQLPQGLPQERAADIRGHVAAAGEGGAPLRKALVRIDGPALAAPRYAVTDDFGRFEIVGIPTGRLTMTVSKAGYLDTAYGADRPAGPGIPIMLQRSLENIVVTLPRGAVITGVIRDGLGDPVEGALVSASRSNESSDGPASTLSDDRGVYRFYGLIPGEYVVGVSPRVIGRGIIEDLSVAAVDSILTTLKTGAGGGRSVRQAGYREAGTAVPHNVRYTTIFYPGTSSASLAHPITVGANDERAGIDITLQPIPAASVHGEVLGPDGRGVSGARVVLSGDGPTLPIASFDSWAAPFTSSSVDGSFQYDNVVPGAYVMTATARAGAEAANRLLWASSEITVDSRSNAKLSLFLRPSVVVSGKVDKGSESLTNLDMTRLELRLRRIGRNPFVGAPLPPNRPDYAAAIPPDGKFELKDVLPGTYELEVVVRSETSQVSWWAKTAGYQGSDLLDFPLDLSDGNINGIVVEMTDKFTEVRGLLETAKGFALDRLSVLVFSTNQADWRQRSRRVRLTRPGTDASYSIQGLPAGSYLLAVVTDSEVPVSLDSVFLASIAPHAISFVLAPSEHKELNVRIGS